MKMASVLAISVLALAACGKDNTPVSMCTGSGTEVNQKIFQSDLVNLKENQYKLLGSYVMEAGSKDSIKDDGHQYAIESVTDRYCQTYPVDVYSGAGGLLKVKVTKDIGTCKAGSEILFEPVYAGNDLSSTKVTASPECSPKGN